MAEKLIAVDRDAKETDFFITPKYAKRMMEKNPNVVVLDFPYNESVQSQAGQDYISKADPRFNRKFVDKHIPGAVKVSVHDLEYSNEEDISIAGTIKSPGEIEELLLSLGITADTPLIVYSDLIVVASYAAFISYWLGVKSVKIIDGGLQAWEEAGYPTESGGFEAEPAEEFGVETPLRAEELIITPDDLIAVKEKNPDFLVASIRGWEEFVGQETGYTFVSYKGEPVGSVYAKASDLSTDVKYFSNDKEQAVVSDEVLEEWASWGVTPDKAVSFHCGGGYRAAAIYFITKQLGWEKVKVYQGGSGQWNKFHLRDPKNYPIQIGNPKDDSYRIIDQ